MSECTRTGYEIINTQPYQTSGVKTATFNKGTFWSTPTLTLTFNNNTIQTVKVSKTLSDFKFIRDKENYAKCKTNKQNIDPNKTYNILDLSGAVLSGIDKTPLFFYDVTEQSNVNNTNKNEHMVGGFAFDEHLPKISDLLPSSANPIVNGTVFNNRKRTTKNKKQKNKRKPTKKRKTNKNT